MGVYQFVIATEEALLLIVVLGTRPAFSRCLRPGSRLGVTIVTRPIKSNFGHIVVVVVGIVENLPSRRRRHRDAVWQNYGSEWAKLKLHVLMYDRAH